MQPVEFSQIDLTGIAAVLTDLDDTLYSFPPMHELALRACFARETLSYDFPWAPLG